jgi:hypothetical protein
MLTAVFVKFLSKDLSLDEATITSMPTTNSAVTATAVGTMVRVHLIHFWYLFAITKNSNVLLL